MEKKVEKKGFTLVELLVVLVIIGVLIGLLLPNTLRAIGQANERECLSNLRSIDTAIQMCYGQTRNWANCDTILELTAGNFLAAAPICPVNNGTGYTPAVNANTGGWEVGKAAHFATWPTGAHTP